MRSLLGAFGFFMLLTGCQGPSITERLTAVSYRDLPGWLEDRLIPARPALVRSCGVIRQKSTNTPMITGANGSGHAKDWQPFCRALDNAQTESALRQAIELHLTPYLVSSSATGDQGTFTGYYEPVLRGSLRQHGPYQTPLYRVPPSKWARFSRAQIVKGKLRQKGLELVWVDSPADAFFLQIQGSGQVKLDTGETIRLGYAGQNGHPYTPIGRVLVQKGAMRLDQVSMQSIKKWLRDNPRQAESVMSHNASYVYFKKNTGDGPIGSHGVPLTPGRSLAVDRQHVTLGTPLWLVTTAPPTGGYSPMQRLMVAQDTGGAIKGVVRGDVFWGSGTQAADLAGHMNVSGRYYLLLPR